MSKNNNNKTESTSSSINDVMDSFAKLKMVSDTLTHTHVTSQLTHVPIIRLCHCSPLTIQYELSTSLQDENTSNEHDSKYNNNESSGYKCNVSSTDMNHQ